MPLLQRGLMAVVCLVSCMPVFSADSSFFDGELRDAPATGLLVVQVLPESNAAAVGVKPGDFLVSYAGQPLTTPDALKDVVEKHAVASPVKVLLRRNGAEQTIEAKPGVLGVKTVLLEKGRSFRIRPPASPRNLDFSLLKEKPLDLWYSFHIAGKKVGYEHNTLALVDGQVKLVSEVAFDFGDGGLQHFVATVAVKATPALELVTTTFQIPGEFDCKEYMAGDGAAKVWHINSKIVEDGKTKEENSSFAPPADMLHDYFVHHACSFMPRTKESCFHYTLLSNGEIKGPGALVALGEEEIDVGGQKVKAMRWDRYDLGQLTTTRWTDARGVIVRNSYGGDETLSVLTTREKALENVRPELKPRTDK